MQIKFDAAVEDFSPTQHQLAKLVGKSERTIRNWRDEGIVIEQDGKILLSQSLPKIYAHMLGHVTGADADDEALDGAELDRKIKIEELRAKRYKNEIDIGESVRKKDMIPFFRNWSKHVSREFDSIDGQLESTLQECSGCGARLAFDGRARERLRETVIRMKNFLHDLHRNVESAKSEL